MQTTEPRGVIGHVQNAHLARLIDGRMVNYRNTIQQYNKFNFGERMAIRRRVAVGCYQFWHGVIRVW